jgi:hypothetical protein
MFERTVYAYKDLEVRVSDQANGEIMDLLDHTIHGAEGGMRYSLTNISQRIKGYKDSIRFVSLYKKNHLTGTIGSCFRISGQGDLRCRSSYLKYLSFQAPYQAALTRRERIKQEKVPEKEDSFKHKVLEIFSKPHILDLEGVNEGDKHLMYAFIESMNERSKNLVNQAGYEYVRSFLTVAFSRFSPKASPDVRKIEEREKEEIKNLLKKQYEEYSLFTTDYIFTGDRYYIIRDGEEIVAGVSVYPAVHKIFHVPGVWGWVLMKIFPYIPCYRRLFHPGEFRFLVFDSIYCKEGEEKSLEKLFESVCAYEGYNTGLTWLDDRSDLYDRIRSGINMGALNRLLNAKPGLVFIRFINFNEKDKSRFYEAPAYISGFDFS